MGDGRRARGRAGGAGVLDEERRGFRPYSHVHEVHACVLLLCPDRSVAGSAPRSPLSRSPPALPMPETPVKVGYLKEPFNINVVKLADFVDGKKVAIELVPFRQFAEVGRALQAGEIQVAAFGYQNAGIFLDAGFTDFTLLAGISSRRTEHHPGQGRGAQELGRPRGEEDRRPAQ